MSVFPISNNDMHAEENEQPPPSYGSMDQQHPTRSLEREPSSPLTSIDLNQFESIKEVQQPSEQVPYRNGASPSNKIMNDDHLDNNKLDNKPPLIQRLAKRIPCFGILLSLCSSLFLGTAGMLVKLTTSVNGIQVAVFRATIQLSIYGFIILLRGLSLKPSKNEAWPVFGRALLGGSSITFSYYALKMIPLGDATTIRFSLPIWTLIVSYLVLNESCDLFKIGAVVVSITGVVLIAKPSDCMRLVHLVSESIGLEVSSERTPSAAVKEASAISALSGVGALSVIPPAALLLDDGSGSEIISIEPGLGDISLNQQLEGSLLALASSICLSMSLIATRMCKHTPTEVIVAWLSILSIIVGTSTLFFLDQWSFPDNISDVVLIILNGACGSAGQWFITNALKVEQPGVIALARSFDIEIAFLYSALLLHEQILSTSIVGSLLVSCGVIAVVLPKWLESRRENVKDRDQMSESRLGKTEQEKKN